MTTADDGLDPRLVRAREFLQHFPTGTPDRADSGRCANCGEALSSIDDEMGTEHAGTRSVACRATMADLAGLRDLALRKMLNDARDALAGLLAVYDDSDMIAFAGGAIWTGQ